jgi:hypothetical protein
VRSKDENPCSQGDESPVRTQVDTEKWQFSQKLSEEDGAGALLILQVRAQRSDRVIVAFGFLEMSRTAGENVGFLCQVFLPLHPRVPGQVLLSTTQYKQIPTCNM